MMKLEKTWSESGGKLDDLKVVIEELDSRTHVKTCSAQDFDIISLQESTLVAEDEKVSFFWFSRDIMETFESEGKLVPTALLSKEIIDETLLEQCKSDTNMILYFWESLKEQSLMFVDSSALITMVQRAHLGGNGVFDNNSLARNLLMAQNIKRYADRKINIVYRVDDNNNQVAYAVFGSKYQRIPQAAILDTCTTLVNSKNAQCLGWTVNHSITEIALSFPNIAQELSDMYSLDTEILPVVFIRTSDIGVASFDAKAGYLIEGCFVETDNYRKKHSISFDAKEFADEVDDALLADVRKLPETLAELLSYKVDSPEFYITKIWDSEFKSISGFVKKNAPIKELLLNEAASMKDMTGYDLAMMFITLQERLFGLNAISQQQIEILAGKIPYKLLRMLAKGAKSDEIALTPLYAIEEDDEIEEVS